MDTKFSDRERILIEYADIKAQIVFLENELADLKPQIEDFIDEGGSNSYELPNRGTFALQSRTTWDYSDKLKQEADKLKKKQEQEQVKGVAIVKNVSRSVIWRPSK